MSLPKLEVSVSVKVTSPSPLAHRGLMGEQTEHVIVGVCFLLMHIDFFFHFLYGKPFTGAVENCVFIPNGDLKGPFC